MILICVVLAVLSTVDCEKPLTRQKRFAAAYAGFPWTFAGAGAYPFGSGFPTFDYPRPQYMPFSFIPYPVINIPKPWYEGENVCKEVRYANTKQPEGFVDWMSEFPNTSSDYNSEHQSCRGSNTKYVCMNRIMDSTGEVKVEATKYECCHGFVRDPTGGPGCVEIDLKNLLPTLRSMGATQFIHMAEKASMTDTLHNGNFTIFCPLNSVMESFVKGQELQNEVLKKPNRRRLKTKILYHDILTKHMTEGFHKLDDFVDGQLMDSENKNSQIRISIYYVPEKVVTANCVPIILADHFARNGIIHVIDRVLPMPSRTVADIIAGDAQFSQLKRMLGQAGLVQTLRNPNKTFTVFAPTDSAFKTSRQKLKSSPNARCLTSVMKHHLVEHVICSSAIPQYARSQNAIGELLSVSRDAHNKLYVDDVQIVVRDMVATNGVVHVIDGLLTTRQANVASEILEEFGLKEFLYLLETAHLKRFYDSLDHVTFFIPSNEAIRAMPPALLQSLIDNMDSLSSILLYHVAQGVAELSSLEQVFSSKMENTSLRVQVRAPYPHAAPQMLVQCATVLSSGTKMCGGSLHVIDKLLLPPKLSLIELLDSLEGFSTLVLLLRAAGLDRRLATPGVHHTLLAPTDDAFHQVGDLFSLLEDLVLATDLIKMHILPGAVCCSRLKNDLLSGRPNIRALEGSLLRMDRYREEALRIGGAHIVDCDMMASNGVIHMVDAIVRPFELVPRNRSFRERLLIRI